MAISESGSITSRDPRARRGRHPQITLGMTGPMADALDDLSDEIGVPVEEVLTQAVALLMVAVEAQKQGRRVCLADDDLNIVGEIVNFGASDEAGDVAPFPVAESDRPHP